MSIFRTNSWRLAPQIELANDGILLNENLIIDYTDTEAFLVRKDGDSGDVFIVDTTNSGVGIGINPRNSWELDVWSDSGSNTTFGLEFDGGAQLLFQAQAAFATFGTNSDHDFSILTNATQRINVESSGNVKIGATTEPTSAILHIETVIDETVLMIQGHSTQTEKLTEWRQDDDTVVASIDNDGDFVVGKIDANATLTDVATATNAFDFQTTVTTTANNAQSHRGLVSSIVYYDNDDLTHAGDSLTGGIFEAVFMGTGTVAGVAGLYFNSTSIGSGTITEGLGAEFNHIIGVFGTAGNMTTGTGARFKHDNLGIGSFGTYRGAHFVNSATATATALYAFDFETDYISNSRAVSVSDTLVQRYMPLSTEDTGITFDSADVVLANTTSGDVVINPFNELLINGTTVLTGGMRLTTTRVTNTYVVLGSDYAVFCDTDGGAFTVTLPVGVDGQTYKIINCGTSTNNLTLAPNGAELLIGVNANLTLADGESLILTYETSEGWY
jgi:hypothetical protein